MNQPIRMYPLRQIMEPSVFVLGERTGQKVFPNAPPGAQPGGPPSNMGMIPGMPMNFAAQQQVMLQQQNSNMELMEQRRRESERQAQQARARAGTGAVVSSLYLTGVHDAEPCRQRPRPEDEDSGGTHRVLLMNDCLFDLQMKLKTFQRGLSL